MAFPTGKHVLSTGAVAVLFTISLFSAAHGQDGSGAFCVSAADRNVGSVYHTGAGPDGSVVVNAENGLFLARGRDGQVALTRAEGADTGPARASHRIPTGVLIGTMKGLFLARVASGGVKTTAVEADTGAVFTLHDLPGSGVLVGAENGTFLAREARSGVTLAPLETATGRVFEMMPFSPNSVLIGAEKGWFIARSMNGKATFAPAGDADTGYARATRSLPGIGLAIEASAGWFLAREQGGAVTVNRFGDAATGSVGRVADFPSGRMLLSTQNGWFIGNSTGGNLVFSRVDGPDGDRILRMIAVPGGVLLYSRDRWFVAREQDGKVTFTDAGAYETTADAFHFHELPGGAVLIGALNGLFVIRPSEANPTLARAGERETGYIFMLREIAGRRALVGARNNFFTAHDENGKIVLTPVGSDDRDTGRLVDVPRYPGYLSHDLPDGTVLFGAQKGLFAAVPRACAGR